jgi:hypothetical protein
LDLVSISKDWEVDHGEEGKGEEAIREEEKSGPGQKEENAEGEVKGEEVRKEESGEESGAETQGAGPEAGHADPETGHADPETGHAGPCRCGAARAVSRALLDTADESRFRQWRRRQWRRHDLAADPADARARLSCRGSVA